MLNTMVIVKMNNCTYDEWEKAFDADSASDAQKFLAPPKRNILEKHIDEKHCPKTFWGIKNEMSGIV